MFISISIDEAGLPSQDLPLQSDRRLYDPIGVPFGEFAGRNVGVPEQIALRLTNQDASFDKATGGKKQVASPIDDEMGLGNEYRICADVGKEKVAGDLHAWISVLFPRFPAKIVGSCRQDDEGFPGNAPIQPGDARSDHLPPAAYSKLPDPVDATGHDDETHDRPDRRKESFYRFGIDLFSVEPPFDSDAHSRFDRTSGFGSHCVHGIG
jgi:hypothetical protein